MSKIKASKKNQKANQALKQLSQEKPRAPKADEPYKTFEQLNGQHPWMDVVPEGYISYPVRKLNNGRVAFFNFALAREMGLVDKSHPHKLNKKLEDKILDTFSIRIINEYDQQNKVYFPKEKIKDNEFMATRYLQLQHNNKQGTTSGDGRCIWNGTFIRNATTWDVSSRGTGVTALAPGAVEAGEPLKSGNTDFGYGCGLAEIDELYSSAIMAEIFHNNGISTERMLTIIDLGGGIGIGVRAGKNLIRPAHLFMYLKQENYDALKRATDYLILRQVQNKDWNFSFSSPHKYKNMLSEVCSSFAKFAATLEQDYIFAWLDWDGDNVLANAGIIDYGSIRQFGLRHDQYRYDDVERWSTNLNEQKQKARLIVQVFIQLVDYLQNKTKKALNEFKNHELLKEFDAIYERQLCSRFLFHNGFTNKQIEKLLTYHNEFVKNYHANYRLLEKVKTEQKEVAVADGKNRPAILNMRRGLRLVVENEYEQRNDDNFQIIPPEFLFQDILAEQAQGSDRKLTPGIAKKLEKLQHDFHQLLSHLNSSSNSALLKRVYERSQEINKEERVTGNAIVYIVNEIMTQRKRGLNHVEVQKVIEEFIAQQSISFSENKPSNKSQNLQPRAKRLLNTVLTIVDGHKEDI